jgi:hypothetical protein
MPRLLVSARSARRCRQSVVVERDFGPKVNRFFGASSSELRPASE